MTTPSINTTPALFVLDPGAAESHHPAAPLPTSQDFVGTAQPYADEADQSRQLQQILAASNLTVDHNDTNDSISHQTITTTVRKTGETPVPSALTTRDPVSDGNLQRVTVSSSVTSTSLNALTGPEQGISLEDGLTTFVRSRSSVPPNVPPLVAGTPLELLSAQNSLMKADPPSSTPPYERPWSGRVSKPPPSSLYATVVAPSQRAPTLTAPNSRDHAVTIPPSLLTPFLSPRSGSKSSLSIKQGSHTSRLNYNLHSSSSRHSGGVNDTPHGHVSASSRTVGQTSQRRSYSVQSPRTFGALSVLTGIETHRVTETARVRTLSTSSSTEHVAYYLHKPVLGYDVDSTLKAMYLQEYRNDREMLGLFSRNESMEQDYRNICRVRKRSTKRSQSTKSQNKEEKIFERLYRVVPDRYRNVVKTNQERLMKAREMVQKPGPAPILWKR